MLENEGGYLFDEEGNPQPIPLWAALFLVFVAVIIFALIDGSTTTKVRTKIPFEFTKIEKER